MARLDTHLTIYGSGNRWAQAEWLRRLADVLERQAERDGDQPPGLNVLPSELGIAVGEG